MKKYNHKIRSKSLQYFEEQEAKSRGLTLLEMLVAVAIFLIFIGAVSGLFVSGIQIQRSILARQELFDGTSYILEYMGRAIRMAKKDTSLVCLSEKKNYENGINWIQFLKFEQATETNVCYKFYLSGDRIYESKGGAAGVPLTSEKIVVNYLKFNLSGDAILESPNLQPKVTIFLDISGRNIGGSRPKVQIQTTISQRDLDVPE